MVEDNFSKHVLKKDRGFYLYGTVPPRQSVPEDKVRKMAEKLVSEIEGLGVDALVIYDVQEESGRTEGERPFPYSPSRAPEDYVMILKECMKTPIECIIYHALPYHPKEYFTTFLKKVVDSDSHAIVLVGGPSQYNGYSVTDAAKIVQQNAETYPLCIGGITLPERHTATGREHLIVAAKVDQGISFFTSQVVYNADNAISFLQEYDMLCKNENKTPARIMFTFAPFGREETAVFLRWLGVELPEGTKKRVLSKGPPKNCVDEAIQICRENLKRILYACTIYGIEIPLGFTTECVSKHREEIEGVADLFKVLRDEMDFYYAERRLARSAERLNRRIVAQSN